MYRNPLTTLADPGQDKMIRSALSPYIYTSPDTFFCPSDDCHRMYGSKEG
jgi:hypothetical protein